MCIFHPLGPLVPGALGPQPLGSSGFIGQHWATVAALARARVRAASYHIYRDEVRHPVVFICVAGLPRVLAPAVGVS